MWCANMQMRVEMRAMKRELASAVSRGALTSSAMRSLAVVTVISGWVLGGLAANAQEFAEPIHQPISDEYGVERKAGRGAFPLPQLIRVGGEGDSGIIVAYTHNETYLGMPFWPIKEVLSERRPDIYEICRSDGLNCERYLWTTISYGDISERFRMKWNGSGYGPNWESEYPTGSTLIGNVFTTKHGLKIIFAVPGTTTVEYPSGITLYFESSDGARSIRNNFGYAIQIEKNQRDSGYRMNDGTLTYQAMNLTVDACNLQLTVLCSATRNRQAVLEFIPGNRPIPTNPDGFDFVEKYLLTNAAGETTQIRNELFSAYQWAPICGMYGSPGCQSPPIQYRTYPVGLTQPGSATETHTFQYSGKLKRGTVGLSHDDIFISRVVKDGIVVDYEPNRYAPGEIYGSYGGVSWFQLRTLINGSEVSYSDSFKLGEYWGQSRRVLQYYKDALGRRTSYPHDYEVFETIGVTYPEGNSYSLVKDARGNVTSVIHGGKPNSGEASLTTTYTYALSCTATTLATCNKPLTITDSKGNVTNYTYNTRGQVLTEILPAPIAGAPRPKVTNTYTMRTAYVKTTTGGIEAAGSPISLMTRTSTCRTQASCAGTTDEEITDYDYGPNTGLNNLLLRGVAVTAANALGQMETLRTCYQYNYFGEKIAETQPKAGLTSCS